MCIGKVKGEENTAPGKEARGANEESGKSH